MDNQFYSLIIDAVEKTMSEKGITLNTDSEDINFYTDGKRAFRITYDEKQKLVKLEFALLKEGEGVDFKTVSSWLFDDNSTEGDAKSIGNDFSDTVLEQLGEKATAQGVRKVEMPSKDKNAETVTIDSFTARFLAVFTAYKPDYVKNVSDYGEFMYDKFYTEFGVKALRDTMESNNKKQINKMFELLNNCYVIGDSATCTTIVCCIIVPAIIDDEKLKRDVMVHLEKYTFLTQAVNSVLQLLSSGKKRSKYMPQK
ncbi:MAG: hypothetical protein ACI396_02420 [Acutalibacteraceae bacterium]